MGANEKRSLIGQAVFGQHNLLIGSVCRVYSAESYSRARDGRVYDGVVSFEEPSVHAAHASSAAVQLCSCTTEVPASSPRGSAADGRGRRRSFAAVRGCGVHSAEAHRRGVRDGPSDF